MTETVTENDVLATPLGFVEGLLLPDLHLYPWQDKFFVLLEKALKKVEQIAVATPNEGGKSSILVAGAALWWMFIFGKGKVDITTKDEKQLREQILPALESQLPKFEGWQNTRVKSPYYKFTTPTGGRLIAYVTDDAARVEGSHGSPDAPLLKIVDEAKSVEESIYQGIDRCSYQCLILTSSTGIKQGTFYKAFTDNRSQFDTIKVGLLDCPHIAQEKIDRIIAKWGLDHPFTRSCLHGEFMDQDDDTLMCCPIEWLENCRINPPKHHPGFTCAFCDFAEGSAQNAIVVRNGNKYEVAAKWREANKNASAGRFIREFHTLGLKPEQIRGDAADAEMLKLLASAGWPISRQPFGAPAKDKVVYKSWVAEAWLEGSAKIQRCEAILPNDEELYEQIVSRRKELNNSGKWEVEDKYYMRKDRGLVSPDLADCLFGAMAEPDMSIYLNKGPFRQESWTEYKERDEEAGVLASIGADSGY